ncbi:chemotaxis protein CheW [Marinitoga sp. 1135]|uniref:Chemotaxis signal transduction protein n=1 Tax=Marinitoga piezophila (strain DSM 14283 / JCM 11233 / KA3) TaxID=443254 RepID=H2J6J3_MARPK|nr:MULTISPECIES: chemotaxis protein CheW [Marinitoga]AEX85178.1 chemotaxis signal transduction protein [Marinitoga piezophila KA3]APT75671.1 chemotaxis protein CheW [Marinitoga sp. 1137]NUU95412.1 chemotaxis protein CheW [Marinitoga sp. 1135]NUU97339.1 chemotaxis protein CheW [Marinitoga sp. 1138]
MSVELKAVSFSVDDEKFAIDINHIDTVIEYQKTTKIPESSDFIEGIVNFRDGVIPIINLRVKFNYPQFEDKLKAKVLVVKIEDKKYGLMVDEVKEVMTITQEQIEEAPEVGGTKANYITGIIKTKDSMIFLIDVEKILTEEEKIEIEKAIK